jgi:hypothetical protein
MTNVDVLIHVHPELAEADRSRVVRELTGSVGVAAASFDKHKHPHALTVQYNPDATQSRQILEVVRKHDPAATMVGL